MNEFNSVPHKLMSVGCGIDGDGMVYPMYGWDVKTKLMTYDLGNGTHIDEIEPDGDWMNALSDDDRKTIDACRYLWRAYITPLTFRSVKKVRNTKLPID